MRNMITGCAVLVVFAGSAMGEPKVKFYDTEANFNAEDGFVADLAANSYNNPTGDFGTFCVELLEIISYGTEYEYQVSTMVKDNGGNGNTDFTTLSGSRVAWLFKTYSNGGESAIRSLDVAFAGFSDSQARELVQRYIWDRFTYGINNYSDGTFTEAMFDDLRDAADAGGAAAGVLFNVRIMNIYTVGYAGDESKGWQDMLTVIPLPGASAMAFAGLLGLSITRRRRV